MKLTRHQNYHSLPSTKQRHDLNCAEINFPRSGNDENRRSNEGLLHDLVMERGGRDEQPGVESGNPQREGKCNSVPETSTYE
jgi:hypothetical protein